MADIDKLNIDSIIQRLLEGKEYYGNLNIFSYCLYSGVSDGNVLWERLGTVRGTLA